MKSEDGAVISTKLPTNAIETVDDARETTGSNRADRDYPGSDATVGQMLVHADEYYAAAMLLIGREDPLGLSSFAPARLCVLQAIEIYLNAFLLFHGLTPEKIRAFQHHLIKRTETAQQRGLRLKAKTIKNLGELEESREYLSVRYGPERAKELTKLPRLFSTFDDVTKKVRKAILEQPYAHGDPRFKRYWEPLPEASQKGPSTG